MVVEAERFITWKGRDMDLNIIGDVHGRYDELILLLDKMPTAVPVSVGDMIDRGKGSYKVLNHFLTHGMAVLGNHEHLFLDYYYNRNYYDRCMWFLNGGLQTLGSFLELSDEKYACPPLLKLVSLVDNYAHGIYVDIAELNKASNEVIDFVKSVIPESYAIWINELPLTLEWDDLIITHAAINPAILFSETKIVGPNASSPRCDSSILWNLGSTRRREEFQVHGHYAYRKAQELKDRNGLYGMNVDTSRGKKLTGIHWPSKVIYEQNFLD